MRSIEPQCAIAHWESRNDEQSADLRRHRATALAQADILQLWQHAGSDRLHHDTDPIKQLLECILVTT